MKYITKENPLKETIGRIKLVVKWLKLFTAILIGSWQVGCASLEPWVKPYERQNLADPITFFGRDPISDSYFHHVRQARESARGAEGSAGGGCGCN